MNSRALAIFLLCLGLLAGFAAPGAPAPVALKAGVFDPPRMAPGFTLPGSNGTPVSLAQFRGRVVLLGFGFTSCQDVCPVTLATLKLAASRLGAQASGVQVVYITVDPAIDDAATMHRYLTAFDPRFVGGTGTPVQLAAVRKAYGIAAERVAGPADKFTHSSFIYLIDKQGRLRALMPFGHGADDYVHDVRVLLAAP